MSKLFLFFISIVLLASCGDKDKSTLPGPESVVRYKLNGALVEIKGSLANNPNGSTLLEDIRKEGRSSRVYNYLKAYNSTDTFQFYKIDYLGTVTYTITPANTVGYQPATFSSRLHNLKGSLGTAPNTEFTLIVDSRSEGTIDGRFYGTAIDEKTGALVTLSEGEFKNVRITH